MAARVLVLMLAVLVLLTESGNALQCKSCMWTVTGGNVASPALNNSLAGGFGQNGTENCIDGVGDDIDMLSCPGSCATIKMNTSIMLLNSWLVNATQSMFLVMRSCDLDGAATGCKPLTWDSPIFEEGKPLNVIKSILHILKADNTTPSIQGDECYCKECDDCSTKTCPASDAAGINAKSTFVVLLLACFLFGVAEVKFR